MSKNLSNETITIDEIKDLGPGTYDVYYTYEGKPFYYQVSVGNVDLDSFVSLNGYGSELEDDYRVVDNYINNTPQNGINVRFSNGHNGYGKTNWEEATSSFLSDISNTYGINPSNTSVVGFSASAGKTIHLASHFVEENDVKNSYVVAMESVREQNITPAERQSLIDHNTTIINAYAREWCDLDRNRDCYDGVHIIDVKFKVYRNGHDVSENAHGIVHDVLNEAGINSIGNGEFDFTSLPSEYQFRGGATYQLEYEIVEHYVDENGNYVTRTLTPQNANSVVNYSNTGSASTLSENRIQSDNEYLSYCLSNIYSAMRSLDLSEIKTDGYSSTTSVPSKESGILFNLLASTTELLSKLKQELFTIGKIGNRFGELDNKLAKEASTLGMNISSSLAPEVEINQNQSDRFNGVLVDLKSISTNNNGENTSISPFTGIVHDVISRYSNSEVEESNPVNLSLNRESSIPKLSASKIVADNIASKAKEAADTVTKGIKKVVNDMNRINNNNNNNSNKDEIITPVKEQLSINDKESAVETIATPQVQTLNNIVTNEKETATKVAATSGSDDSYREVIKPKWEEIKPSTSGGTPKTKFEPGKSVITDYKNPNEVEKIKPVNPEPPKQDTPVEVEPIKPTDPIIIEPEPEPEPTPEPEPEPVKEPKDNTVLKTLGIAAGVGTGLGAIAYGVNNQIGKSELKDGFAYTYEKESAPSNYLEQESNYSYNPYIIDPMYQEKEKSDEDEDEEEGDEV